MNRRTEPASDRPAAVVMLTRRWEDFLSLGLTEIREYGASSVQVMRRLRALLGELRETVRPEHRAAVEDELRRLDATVTRTWSDTIDFDLAGEHDGQGIGGPSARTRQPGDERDRTPAHHASSDEAIARTL